MHRLATVLWWSSLAAADLTKLQALTDDHRLFELRRELHKSGSDGADTLFYRGIIASGFGQERDGVSLIQAFLATNPRVPLEEAPIAERPKPPQIPDRVD